MNTQKKYGIFRYQIGDAYLPEAFQAHFLIESVPNRNLSGPVFEYGLECFSSAVSPLLAKNIFGSIFSSRFDRSFQCSFFLLIKDHEHQHVYHRNVRYEIPEKSRFQLAFISTIRQFIFSHRQKASSKIYIAELQPKQCFMKVLKYHRPMDCR